MTLENTRSESKNEVPARFAPSANDPNVLVCPPESRVRHSNLSTQIGVLRRRLLVERAERNGRRSRRSGFMRHLQASFSAGAGRTPERCVRRWNSNRLPARGHTGPDPDRKVQPTIKKDATRRVP